MKKLIITGASGFVGANLVHFFLKKGFTIHACVRSSSSLHRLNSMLPDMHLHKDTLSSQQKIEHLLKTVKPDGIIHLATYGAYPSQTDIPLTIETNIFTILNLFEALRKIPCPKLIIAGSSSEYGKKETKMKETDVLRPNSLYGAAKAMQTHIAGVYGTLYNIPSCVLRLFAVYGPNEEPGRLVRTVIEKALKNEPILLATGKEARDFIYVDDVARACLSFLRAKPTYGDIFNIGTGIQTTTEQLAKKIVTLTKSSSPIRLNVYKGRPWDSYTWKADLNTTFAYSTFKPLFSLEKGLQKTIQTYLNSYDSKN